ncbi:LysR family transcriptional regulator [Arthrobacter sp. SDTb3-6]|uniref:LysR family transcriptional regulator n=1 Tax=Arthrobacter sp. SDTb3-6 TaxID=2713571 RepID=UPI00159E2F12|nr:LysR family transcriptional regulator [Arthrobacter sp. SDTb3-6]NVN00404.1 LysR family transcriptional regulator [Arthrobacter sp. SDTb3-6]
MSNVSLRQLEYLIAAAETGSVTAAAARVYLSQSAVSTALTDLEEALGVQIFIRHPRGLALTNAGQQVLTDARRLVAGMEDLRNSARESSQSLSGKLVVGCYSTLAPILLPRVIADFTASHPGVDLSFIEGSQTQLTEQLRNGTLDLALLYEYDAGSSRFARDMAVTVVVPTPPYVILPERHPLASRETLSLKELAPLPLILFDLPPGGDYFLSFFSDEILAPNIKYRTTSFEMVRALVARGLGYSILSQRTNINMSYEGLGFVTRPLTGEMPGLNVAAVHLSGVRLTRRAVAFIDQCRTSLGAGA